MFAYQLSSDWQTRILISCLFLEIIYELFFYKGDSLFRDVSPNICKYSFFNSLNFSLTKLHFLKVYETFPAKRMQRGIQSAAEYLRWSFLRKQLKVICRLLIFSKKLHLKCSTGFCICLWDLESFINEKVCNYVNSKVI